MTREELLKKFSECDEKIAEIRRESSRKVHEFETEKYTAKQRYFDEHAEYKIGEKVLYNEDGWGNSPGKKWIPAFVSGYNLSYDKYITYTLKQVKKDGTMSKRFIDQWGTSTSRVKKYEEEIANLKEEAKNGKEG